MAKRPPSLYWNYMNVETGHVTRLKGYRMPNGQIEYHRTRAEADRAAKVIRDAYNAAMRAGSNG